MPSPVAHALAGLTLAAWWRPGQRVLAATAVIVVAAGLPDLDVFSVQLFGKKVVRALQHHHALHSISFVAVAALILAPLLARGRSFQSAWAVLLLAGLTHLGLDMLNHDPAVPLGIPLLWPFSNGYWHAPFDIFPGYKKSGLKHLLSLANSREYLTEVAWLLPPLLAVLWRQSKRRLGESRGDLLFRLARLHPEMGAVEQFQALAQGAGQQAGEGEAFVRLAIDAGVAPLLYRHLPKSAAVPRELLGTLWTSYHDNVRWNEDSLAQIARILDGLRSAGVAVVPLKGAVGAVSLLGDAGLYAGSDIDLLVRRESLETAVACLRELGYRDSHAGIEDSLRASYHHCLKQGLFHVEVHWNLVRPPFVADPGFWWEDAVPCRTPAGDAWALAPEKYLLYLIFRLYTHGFRLLRFFVLPVQIANGAAGPVDWERFAACARSCRMTKVAAFALAFMKDRLGADVPEPVAAPGRRQWRLHDRIARAVTGGEPVNQLTRLRLYALFDSPVSMLRMVVGKVFPPVAEIRYRYGLKGSGWRLPVLYLLNPVIVLVDVDRRQKFIRWFVGGGSSNQ